MLESLNRIALPAPFSGMSPHPLDDDLRRRWVRHLVRGFPPAAAALVWLPYIREYMYQTALLHSFKTPPRLPHTRIGELIICFNVELFAGTLLERQGQIFPRLRQLWAQDWPGRPKPWHPYSSWMREMLSKVRETEPHLSRVHRA